MVQRLVQLVSRMAETLVRQFRLGITSVKVKVTQVITKVIEGHYGATSSTVSWLVD